MTPFETSTFALVTLALSAALVVVGLRAARWLLELAPLSRKRRKQAQRVLPLVEVTAVIVLLLFAIPGLVGGHPQLSPIALVLVLLAVVGVTWSSLKDLAAGVVFRASAPADVGDVVRIGEVTGRVVRVGYRTLELETEDGDQAFIPMSQASRSSIHRTEQVDRVVHRFRVDIPAHLGAAEARERARVAALLSHWSAIGREPEVGEISSTELDVKVFALAPSRGGEIEALVRRALVDER